jgi:2-methylisocitrate lyase-like PEP mutase family enzyme
LSWLADRLARDEILVAPGAHDAVSARLIADAGFEGCYCGGYATIASTHGLPDLGLLGLAEVSSIYARLVRATSIPLIVDADTGYGGPMNVARTVEELGRLGVEAVQLEDQVNPKRCGHTADKQVVEREEAELRIRVAVESAAAGGPAIIARTDALATLGLEEAIERANRFLALGATAALIDAPRTSEELAEIALRLEGPAVFNAAATGRGPRPNIRELGRLGISMAFFPIELLFSAYGAMRATLDALARDGELDREAAWPAFDEFNAFLGMPELRAWERELTTSKFPTPNVE